MKDSASVLAILAGLGFDDWRTVREGYRLGLITTRDVVPLADQAISRAAEPSTALALLSSSLGVSVEEIEDALNQLAEAEPMIADDVVRDRCRLALLLHLRRTETNEERLLERVAEVYGAFGYPRDMEQAVYYVPPTPAAYAAEVGDQLESPVEALDNLLENLRTTLQAG